MPPLFGSGPERATRCAANRATHQQFVNPGVRKVNVADGTCPCATRGRMLGGTRETSTRGPDSGRRGRAESLANPARLEPTWVMRHMQDVIHIEAPVEHV